MSITAMTLMPTHGQAGYNIHINTTLDSESRTCIEEITAKYGLQIREHEGRVVIFKPLF